MGIGAVYKVAAPIFEREKMAYLPPGVRPKSSHSPKKVCHSKLAELDYASAGHVDFAGTKVSNTFSELQVMVAGTSITGATVLHSGDNATQPLSVYGQTGQTADLITCANSSSYAGKQWSVGPLGEVVWRGNGAIPYNPHIKCSLGGDYASSTEGSTRGRLTVNVHYQDVAQAAIVVAAQTSGTPTVTSSAAWTFTGDQHVASGNFVLDNGYAVQCKDSSGTPVRTFFLDAVNNYGARNEASSGSAYYGCAGSNTTGVIVLQTAGTNRHIVQANGQFVMNTASGVSASVVPLVVMGSTSQTADLTEWQDSTGTVLASVNSSGSVSAISATLQPYYNNSIPLSVVSPAIRGAAVSGRELTSNVATITTSSAHGFIVGEGVIISSVSSTFNGAFTIASVPSSTTFTYAKTASNVSFTSSSGSANVAQIQPLQVWKDPVGATAASMSATGVLTAAATTISGTATIANVVVSGNVSALGSISAGYIVGDGSGLYNVSTDKAILEYGPYSSIPTAGTTGRAYLSTDSPLLLSDNGSSWQGFGPLFGPFTKPLTSDFATQVGFLGSTSQSSNKGCVRFKDTGGQGNAFNWAMCLKSVSSTWVMTMALQVDTVTNAYPSWGIVMRNSSTNKFTTFGIEYRPQESRQAQGVYNWTNATTYSSGASQSNLNFTNVYFFQAECDGTYIYCRTSSNFQDWNLYKTITLSGSFVASVDQVGYGINNYGSASGENQALNIMHAVCV